jgi:hypothetical protein
VSATAITKATTSAFSSAQSARCEGEIASAVKARAKKTPRVRR